MEEIKKIRNRILLQAVIILICLSLSIIIIYRGNNYGSCSYCEINFKQNQAFGKSLDSEKVFTYKAQDLYNNLTQDICLIKWDHSNGYYEP